MNDTEVILNGNAGILTDGKYRGAPPRVPHRVAENAIRLCLLCWQDVSPGSHLDVPFERFCEMLFDEDPEL